MLTILDIIKKTTAFFEAKGLEHARLDAELLIGHVLAMPRMQLYVHFERPMSGAELDQLRPLVRRRSLREPLQYIVGIAEFSTLRLKVDRRALIPRPETERLCELITERLASRPPATVADLGTGSGALALALATTYTGASVVAVDISTDALALARENAEALGLAARVRLLASDWYAALEPESRFDLIVANPPYLSDEETAATAPEVRDHEPRVALSSGPDGMEALRRILGGAAGHLAEGGMLAVETGIAQREALRALAGSCGLGRVESMRDLTDRDRYLFAWRA